MTLLDCTSLALHSHALKLFALHFHAGMRGALGARWDGHGRARGRDAERSAFVAARTLLSSRSRLGDWEGAVSRAPPPPPRAPLSFPAAQLSPPISALLGHTMALWPLEWAAFVRLQSAVGAVKIHLGPYTTWTENTIRKAKGGKKKGEVARRRGSPLFRG